MNLSMSPVARPRLCNQEDTTQRSDSYGVGQADTVISATGQQAVGSPNYQADGEGKSK